MMKRVLSIMISREYYVDMEKELQPGPEYEDDTRQY